MNESDWIIYIMYTVKYNSDAIISLACFDEVCSTVAFERPNS